MKRRCARSAARPPKAPTRLRCVGPCAGERGRIMGAATALASHFWSNRANSNAPRDSEVPDHRAMAALYGVETRALNQAVRRNKTRLPVHFMFTVEPAQWESLRSQFVTLNKGRGSHRRRILRASSLSSKSRWRISFGTHGSGSRRSTPRSAARCNAGVAVAASLRIKSPSHPKSALTWVGRSASFFAISVLRPAA